ncbi:hypothetical protein FQA39_LY04954 [Lamprigera yunnana]|nr:hypothetical protein FQA39_LY04954 [Lamprigera yunnana]
MAANIMNIKKRVEESLHDNRKPWTSILDQIEKSTGVNRLYVFLVTMLLIGLWLVFGFAGQLVCNSIGFVYPAYVSIRAIESPSKNDDTKWLTYWVVFSIFSVVEYFADFIVGWFPMYWLMKCIFMVWLMIPTDFNGSIILYERVIKPYYLKHHSVVDDVLKKAETEEAALRKISDWKFTETRPSEKPKLRWQDQVRIDNWTRLITDRNEWNKKTNRAKTHKL